MKIDTLEDQAFSAICYSGSNRQRDWFVALYGDPDENPVLCLTRPQAELLYGFLRDRLDWAEYPLGHPFEQWTSARAFAGDCAMCSHSPEDHEST